VCLNACGSSHVAARSALARCLLPAAPRVSSKNVCGAQPARAGAQVAPPAGAGGGHGRPRRRGAGAGHAGRRAAPDAVSGSRPTRAAAPSSAVTGGAGAGQQRARAAHAESPVLGSAQEVVAAAPSPPNPLRSSLWLFQSRPALARPQANAALRPPPGAAAEDGLPRDGDGAAAAADAEAAAVAARDTAELQAQVDRDDPIYQARPPCWPLLFPAPVASSLGACLALLLPATSAAKRGRSERWPPHLRPPHRRVPDRHINSAPGGRR